MQNLTFWIMVGGWIFVLIWVPIVILSNRKAHPKALFILFFAEMWERFSYYGMRALLTLYMVKVLFVEMTQGEADEKALGIYGSYTAMVYMIPVIGGILADRVFGFRKAVIFGGILMMLGHFALALEGMLFGGNMMLFFMSLALIIVGNGFFKPNLSSFLGDFYGANDPRKDGAFTIYYMGVNIGAFLSILTCGYVGEEISWHYGFGLAGIGMALGLLVFWLLGPATFGKKGLYPNSLIKEGEEDATEPDPDKKKQLKRFQTYSILGTFLSLPLIASMLNLDNIVAIILGILGLVIPGYLVFEAFRNENKAEGQRLLVVVVLFFFHAIFWALFEQAGGSITLFTDRNVDRVVFGSELPASIFQFFNALFIMLLAPVFSWLWKRLNDRNREPSTPMKFVLGLAQLAVGFLLIVIGTKLFAVDGMMPLLFLVLMYLFHTTGELSLSPVGLSMITKLSPKKIVGFVMGAWFLSISVANSMAGQIGKLTASENAGEDTDLVEGMMVYTDTYLTWGVFVVGGAALLLFFLVPTLRKWMHGIH